MVRESCGHVGLISFSRQTDGKFGKIFSYGFSGFGVCNRQSTTLRHLKSIFLESYISLKI